MKFLGRWVIGGAVVAAALLLAWVSREREPLFDNDDWMGWS